MSRVPDAWNPPDDLDEPSPGGGAGFPVLLVVIGLLLLLVALGGVRVVLDVLRSITGLA